MKALILALLVSQTTSTKIVLPQCGTPTQSVVSIGVTASDVPATPMVGRYWIDVCVSVENATSPVVKCRMDGTPVIGTGNPGDALGKGDCIRYVPPTGGTIKCISNTAATAVSVTECSKI